MKTLEELKYELEDLRDDLRERIFSPAVKVIGKGRIAINLKLKNIEWNSEEILTYIEIVHHRILPGGGVPETPMSRKERGTSRPPLTAAAMDLAEANAGVSAALSQVVRPRNMPARDVEGRPAWIILSDMLFDATAVRRWRVEESEGKPQNLRACLALCKLLAWKLSEMYGDTYRLPRVVTSPRSAREKPAAQKEQSRNPQREAPKVRKITAKDSYRSIVRDLEAMVEKGYSKEAAKHEKAAELDCSPGRIAEAITFVNKERTTKFSGRWVS